MTLSLSMDRATSTASVEDNNAAAKNNLDIPVIIILFHTQPGLDLYFPKYFHPFKDLNKGVVLFS